MAPADAPIRAGLIFQQQELATRLRQTLVEAGISINAEFNVEALRTADLSAHEIEVYIVNLEPEIEDHLDEVTDLLEDATMPVVFNDAGVSSDLSGWDQARWARHLAAKIRKGRSNLPPTPENAEPIPSPKRATAVALPFVAEAPATELAVEPEPLATSPGALVEAVETLALAELSPLAEPAVPAEPEPISQGSAILTMDLAPPSDAAEPEPTLELLDLDDGIDAAAATADAPIAAEVANQSAQSTPDLAKLDSLELFLEDEPNAGSDHEITTDTVAEPVGSMEFDSVDETDLEMLDLLGEQDDSPPPPASVGGDQAAYAAELAVGMFDEQAAEPPLTEESGEWLDSAESPKDTPAEGLDWDLGAAGNIQAEISADESPLPDFTADSASPAPTLDDPGMLAELLGEGSTQNDSDLSAFEGADLGIDDLTVNDSIDMLGDAMSLDAVDFSSELEAPSIEPSGSTDWQGGDAVLAEIETLSETEFNPPATTERKDFLDHDPDFGGLSLNLDAPAAESAGEELVDLDALLASDSSELAEESANPTVLDAHPPPAAVVSQDQLSDELSGLQELPDLDSWSLEPLPGEEERFTPAEPPKASQTPTKRVEPVPEPTTSLEDLSISFDDLGLVPLEAEQAPPPMVGRSQPVAEEARLNLMAMDSEPALGAKQPLARTPATPPTPSPVAAPPAPAASSAGPRKIVILGASIGGPDSIRDFLSRLNTDLHGAFILVQHMGAEFLDLMAQQLDRVSPLAVNLARHGHTISEGEVVIAPVGQRLRVDENCKLDLSADAGPTAYSPSIDQVLSDSLERWGADRLLVIIFSGMASDAVEGSKQLAAAGTPVWAQDPASCVISSMVDGVVAAKVVSFVGSPEQLAEQANRLLA